MEQNKRVASRLLYTFEAGVRALLAGPGDVGREVGKNYRAIYDIRRGARRLKIETARALVAHLRRKAQRLDQVAEALERAADVSQGLK